MTLPRFTGFPNDSVGALSARLSEYARDVLNFLRALPTLELKTFTTTADWPTMVSLDRVKLAQAVILGHVYATGDPTASLTPGNVDWGRSSEGGIIIRGISGLTATTEYNLTLLVVG